MRVTEHVGKWRSPEAFGRTNQSIKVTSELNRRIVQLKFDLWPLKIKWSGARLLQGESLATQESTHPESSVAWPDLARLIAVVWLCIIIFDNHALLLELHPRISVGLCFQVLVSEWIMSPLWIMSLPGHYSLVNIVPPVSEWILYPSEYRTPHTLSTSE